MSVKTKPKEKFGALHNECAVVKQLPLGAAILWMTHMDVEHFWLTVSKD
jgi:hypothetical protein